MLALFFYESNTCLTAHGIGSSLSIEMIHVECCLDVLIVLIAEYFNQSSLAMRE